MNNEIEIYDIQKDKDGYIAEYALNGEDKTPFIETKTLIEYIEANNLHLQEIVSQGTFSEDRDGLDQSFTDPCTILEEDYYEIVSQYIKDLHKC